MNQNSLIFVQIYFKMELINHLHQLFYTRSETFPTSRSTNEVFPEKKDYKRSESKSRTVHLSTDIEKQEVRRHDSISL